MGKKHEFSQNSCIGSAIPHQRTTKDHRERNTPVESYDLADDPFVAEVCYIISSELSLRTQLAHASCVTGGGLCPITPKHLSGRSLEILPLRAQARGALVQSSSPLSKFRVFDFYPWLRHGISLFVRHLISHFSLSFRGCIYTYYVSIYTPPFLSLFYKVRYIFPYGNIFNP